ncbi:extracellular solute-binding protein [Phytoactinopolyspora limicola]|uniref:extracellular solute-binding protein n=1 Tax=Phytoactinopolyspora limicola TaxID=2715536 RepID=UPI00140B4B7C|nr:extracellular solute-binding protein [Phytoactinopolyspora limicola]
MVRPVHRGLVALAGTAMMIALAACGADSSTDDAGASDEPDLNAEVTITVSDLPPTEQAESRQAMLDKIADFEAAHPTITIDAQETKWAAETFNAMLAGGTLPIVTAVPFTEIQALASRGQATDLTDAVADSAAISALSPTVMESVTRDGRIYGVPYQAYTMGLVYNRGLFEEAGLDPDDPPQTWDDVRAAAKTITEQTGQPGFISMTASNTGGWVLSTMSYAFGGQMQEVSGDDVLASFAAPRTATTEALELLRAMRWEDESMGANFLLDIDDARNEFAAGRAGMFVHGADVYGDMVVNRGLPGEHYGVAPLPQSPDGIGTLGGGAIDIVSPNATPEQVAAAIKWIEYHRLGRLSDEEQAVTWAESRAADDLPVGTPELPIVDAAQYETYLGWIDSYINVPRDNYELYLSTVEDIPLVPEPPVKAQELYAALDPVVQAVLTREDADLAELLDQAERNVNDFIAAG